MEKENLMFDELNEELKKINIKLSVVCVGGYVLQHHNIRTTNDIDGFFNESPVVKSAIKKIGDKYKANTSSELWLNNSVQNMNSKPPESICDTIYESSNLKISIPPLEYIAGMKLASGRRQDIRDVSMIIDKLKIQDVSELKKRIEKYNFNSIDESLFLEAFGEAYGMEWLEKYFIKQEEEIFHKANNDSIFFSGKETAEREQDYGYSR